MLRLDNIIDQWYTQDRLPRNINFILISHTCVYIYNTKHCNKNSLINLWYIINVKIAQNFSFIFQVKSMYYTIVVCMASRQSINQSVSQSHTHARTRCVSISRQPVFNNKYTNKLTLAKYMTIYPWSIERK